ncbi:glycosyltransferase [Rubrobacter tropicus]|uniref:Glycosyltransferase n=1 Tax=Rubrobacter tropicus TaxID=2653851 RepID=A0A6G8QCN2_9ACTN|nr:glycosyltransferase [Rubrobacter tropicus]QIN84203.1 glycosyltransferase [Rubrobacter tropicus]
MSGRRMYFMTPTFRPVGGVVKIFDYVNHALAFGYEPVIACPEKYKAGLPVFEISRFSHLTPENGIRFVALEQAGVGPDDFAFLSWPSHYPILEPRIGRGASHEQVISIVQNVRWANPTFERGYAVRLLSRPMARIMTNDVVLEACKPYLNESSMTETIMLGNDSAFFARERLGGFKGPIKVGYTTWKSDVGDRVAAMFRERGSGFRFRAIRNPVGWKELKKLYQWSDVFLATPLVEEGFYMPGLEAMAAGAVVITSDAGGNRAYCRFGENCLPARFENAGDYAAALRALRGYGAGEIEALRRGGYEAVGRHTLEYERDRFGGFMEKLEGRLQRNAGASRGSL